KCCSAHNGCTSSTQWQSRSFGIFQTLRRRSGHAIEGLRKKRVGVNESHSLAGAWNSTRDFEPLLQCLRTLQDVKAIGDRSEFDRPSLVDAALRRDLQAG